MKLLEPVLIAADWGSSTLRVALLDERGMILETRRSTEGVLQLQREAFRDCLANLIDDWRDAHAQIPVILSGMIGSRNGWHEVPYVQCPASLEDLAGNLFQLPGTQDGRTWIVPGLCGKTPDGRCDVMRGEEVQLFGALLAQPPGPYPRTAVLPGTHSKWVQTHGERITGFATSITGEMFGLLSAYGSLSRLLGGDDEEEVSDEEFMQGISLSRTPGGLLHHVFALRSACLLGYISAAQVKDRLSGVLVGNEVLAMHSLFSSENPVMVIGAQALVSRYAKALSMLAVDASIITDEEASAGGAVAVARAAGILQAQGILR